MKHNLVSFFSGSGFLDLGFEMTSGYAIHLTNEIHASFISAYTHARKKMKLAEPSYGNLSESIIFLLSNEHRINKLVNDIRKQTGYLGFIGGPPCPDFSVGGKNRGKQGDHGTLSAAYVRVIEQYCPDYFLFENVKGLWKTKKHREFYEELKFSLFQAGYILTERLVNAIEYGVPQDRDRIILLGFHKGFLSDLGLAIKRNIQYMPSDIFPWHIGRVYSKEQAFDRNWPTTNQFVADSDIPVPAEIIKDLTVQYWFDMNKTERHPNSQHHFQPRAGLKRFESVDEGDDSRKSYKRLHRWRYSPTVAYGNNEVHLHPYKPRRLSAAEALALQSLPKEFELPPDMTLTDMFKTIGNGVPYLMARGLAQAIKAFLENIS
jgi:DNA (cytosine-5)-methyltransferase 1